MAATPRYGVMLLIGLGSRMTYSKDIYCSDVAEAEMNWDSGGGATATSEQFWTPPEDCVIRDFAVATGMADTTKLQLTRNGVPSGDMLRYAPHLDSIATRPALNIVAPAGVRIGAIQKAN